MYVIILAAGTAARMKEPKLLMEYKDESILFHMVNSILDVSLIPIIVTGCYKEIMDEEIKNIERKLNIRIESIHNEIYESGQLSSLITGVKYLEKILSNCNITQKNEPYFITVADLPLIEGHHYLDLLQKLENHDALRPFVSNTFGHPVLLQSRLNKQIISLNSNGKKEGLRSFLKRVDTFKFESEDKAYISDIDTQDSYNELIKNSLKCKILV
ncbi:MAG: NTP transferase domain-containing protein [Spirochaetaceae bacterium]|nr:NTP transferase domain-containing protein [Spirochaetaceae bacterium]